MTVSRPGYGGSSPTTDASLRAGGRDTAALAASLALGAYAVLRISGGGPFAVATAVADPAAVGALALVGGVGPWRELDAPTGIDIEERGWLDQFDAGDRASAVAGIHRLAEAELGGLRASDGHARVDAMLAEESDLPMSPLTRDAGYRALWAANMAVVLDRLDGYVFDKIAWGRARDVDPSDVVAPTLVWDAEGDGALHGRWYADRIEGSELVTFPAETHLDICDAHWPEVIAGILGLWV